MLFLKLLSGLWGFFNPFDKAVAAEIAALTALFIYVKRNSDGVEPSCPLEQWQEWDAAIPNIVLYVRKITSPILTANDACMLSVLQVDAVTKRIRWLKRTKYLKLAACVALTVVMALLKHAHH